MASDVQELTINYTEEDISIVRELDKEVLTKGAWSTIMYRYQDWDRAKEAYGPEKYTIRRYQKSDGEYRQRSKFNISNRKQAGKIIEALTKWVELPEQELTAT
jgi:hypothetical protein